MARGRDIGQGSRLSGSISFVVHTTVALGYAFDDIDSMGERDGDKIFFSCTQEISIETYHEIARLAKERKCM